MPYSRYSPDQDVDHGSEPANRIHRNLNEIIDTWEARARVHVLAARDKSHEELVDSLPYFLHGLIETLSPGGEDIETGDAAFVFRRHGEQRAKMVDFTLKQLVTEFTLIREVLFEYLELGDHDLRDRLIINRAVDFGLKESAAEFIHYRTIAIQSGNSWLLSQLEHERHVLESVTEPFMALDFDSRFTFVNDAAATLFGRAKESLINQSIWDVFPVGLATSFREACKMALVERANSSVDLIDDAGSGYEARVYPCKDGYSVLLMRLEVTSPSLARARNERPAAQSDRQRDH